MTLIGIVAMTHDRVIGRDGTLPWHLPDDLKFFKRTTHGHPVVMGRTTYESIGRPLPGRRNVVLTRNPDWQAEGVDVIHAPDELSALSLEGKVFIIGGAKVYAELLDKLDELLVTWVHEPHAGDTYFPAFEDRFDQPDVLERHHAFDILHYQKSEHQTS